MVGPVAGAGGRLRGDADRLSTATRARPWRWASARRWRCIDAAASARHGGGRGDDQHRVGAHREAVGRQAVGQLDGGGGPARARTRASTTRCTRWAWSCARRSASPSRWARTRMSMRTRGRSRAARKRGDGAAVAHRDARSRRCCDVRRVADAAARASRRADTRLLFVDLAARAAAPGRLGAGAGLRAVGASARTSRIPALLRGFFAAVQALNAAGRLARVPRPLGRRPARDAGGDGLRGPLRAGRGRCRRSAGMPSRPSSTRSWARCCRCARRTWRACARCWRGTGWARGARAGPAARGAGGAVRQRRRRTLLDGAAARCAALVARQLRDAEAARQPALRGGGVRGAVRPE